MIEWFTTSTSKAIIYFIVMWGQSNQEGRPLNSENLPIYLEGNIENAYITNATTYDYDTLSLETCQGMPWGSELEMSYRLIQDGVSEVFISKYGSGGTYLGQVVSNDWLPQDQELYTSALNRYDSSLARLTALRPNAEIKTVWLWCQGEQDMDLDATANAYRVNLAELYDSVISQINPDLMIISRTSIKVPKDATRRDSVRTAQTEVSEQYGIPLINTDDFTVDDAAASGLHFDAAGLVNKARHETDTMLFYLRQ